MILLRAPRRTNVLVDALALALAVGASALGAAAGADVSLGWCAAQGVLTLAALHLRQTAPQALSRRPLPEFGRALAVTGNAAVITIAARAVAGDGDGALADAARMWVFAGVYLGIRFSDTAAARRRGDGQVGTLIVGAGTVGTRLAGRLLAHPEFGLRPIGFLDADPPALPATRPVPVLGRPEDAEAVISAHRVGHVIAAFSRASDDTVAGLGRRCRRLGVEFSVVPRLFEEMSDRVRIDHVGTIPLMRVEHADPRGWRFVVKHVADRVIAAVALVVLSPAFVVIAAAVAVSSRGGVIFRQQRVGRDGRTFTILKFRTMTGDPASDGEADARWAATTVGRDAPRSRREVTRVGALLRKLCLDELPQLVNVLRGDMSLVGPRPERVGYVEQFRGEIHRYDDRHRVKSGLTGWAQVNGLRGETSLAERNEHDNFYIENWSLLLDLRILVLTPAVIALATLGAARGAVAPAGSVDWCLRAARPRRRQTVRPVEE